MSLGKMGKTGRNEEETREEALRLREWLLKQPHLPHEVDEDFLLSFVNAYSLETAKKKLDTLFTLRGRNPQLFNCPQRDTLDKAFTVFSKKLYSYYLPKTTPEGYRVIMSKILDMEDLVHNEVVVYGMMMLEIGLMTWPDMKGIIIVMDNELIDKSIMMRLDPVATAVSFQWVQKAIPLKLKKLLLFNTHVNLDIVLQIVKPFVKQKMIERTVLTKNGSDILKDHIPEEMLPCDYGGQEKSSQELAEYWRKILVQNREWFLKQSLQCSDETKRPADSPSIGTDGSFRYLQID